LPMPSEQPHSPETTTPPPLQTPQPQPLLENGFVVLPSGDWLCGRTQPAACLGNATLAGLKGWLVPDRGCLQRLTTTGKCWFSHQRQPFLTRLDALPDTSLHVVSAKLLVAPFECRKGASNLRLIPMNFRSGVVVTDLQGGWAIAATRSRVTRVTLEDGGTLTVHPEALVAWCGPRPTGFCPKLSIWDMLLPRRPARLCFSFHGPATIWFEGSAPPPAPNTVGCGE